MAVSECGMAPKSHCGEEHNVSEISEVKKFSLICADY
jgi:hypothetical protein